MDFSRKGIRIDGVDRELYSGSIHYWRLDPEKWDGILDSVKELGFRIVETYIPWSVHEVEKGAFDFGERSKSKDLPRFIDLCASKDLALIVRPGPHINAEMTYFGYPRRIILDPDVMAKTSLDTPYVYGYPAMQFPIPSYASDKLFDETEVFFGNLAPLLASKTHPNGPIVAIQYDNETCYFFVTDPYVLDYSDGSIALYRRFLGEKYDGDVGSLNERYRSNHRSFGDVRPPRSFDADDRSDLPRHFDWTEYKEYQIKDSIKRIKAMWTDRGIDLPSFHNLPVDGTFYATPFDVVGLEREECVSVAGIDSYSSKEESGYLKDLARFLCGSSLLPFIPEFGSGAWFSNTRTFSPEDERFNYFYAYMYGLKASNFYMIVDRDRWQGAPISGDNGIRGEYHRVFRDLRAFLDDSGLIGMERKRSIVVAFGLNAERFRKMTTTSPLPASPFVDIPVELLRRDRSFGWKYIDGNGTSIGDWKKEVDSALESRGEDFDYTTMRNSPEALEGYGIAIFPTYDFIDDSEWDLIAAYARNGGIAVVGPGFPYLDMSMNPRRSELLDLFDGEDRSESPIASKEYGKGAIVHYGSIDAIGEAIDSALSLGCCEGSGFSSRQFELTFFADPESGRQVLFAANPGGRFLEGGLDFSGKKAFRRILREESVEHDGTMALSLEPYSVVAWEVSAS